MQTVVSLLHYGSRSEMAGVVRARRVRQTGEGEKTDITPLEGVRLVGALWWTSVIRVWWNSTKPDIPALRVVVFSVRTCATAEDRTCGSAMDAISCACTEQKQIGGPSVDREACTRQDHNP